MQVAKKARGGVHDGALKFGVASFSLACQVNSDRSVDKVEVSLPPIPNTPLEDFLRENADLMRGLKTAICRTQLQLGLLWSAKSKGDKEEFARLLNLDDMEEEEVEEEELGDLTPPFPIIQMSLDQLTAYFSKLIKRLLEMQGEKGRLWAGSGKPAGKKTTYIVINLQYMSIITGRIDAYDEVAESILPRNGYQGRGTGGEGIAGKLRMVTCYLLGKIGKDHNSWFHDVKPGFVPTVLDFTTTTSVDRMTSKTSKGKPLVRSRW